MMEPKKIKKLIVKRETITSLSNHEQSRLRGAGSAGPCTQLPTCMNDAVTVCVGGGVGYSDGCYNTIIPNTVDECGTILHTEPLWCYTGGEQCPTAYCSDTWCYKMSEEGFCYMYYC